MGVGKFTKPPKASIPIPQGQSVVLGSTLPVVTPALAPSDLALLSDGSVKGAASGIRACLSDPLLAKWQENMRRALEYVSVVEALLSTVSRSIFGDASVQPEFSDPRSRLCCATLVQAYECSLSASLPRTPTLRWRIGMHCFCSLNRLHLLLCKPCCVCCRSRPNRCSKQEDFIVKAATAALLPHPKPWGVKAAGAKRKASQPPHQEDLRMPKLPRYDSAPSTSLSKQQGAQVIWSKMPNF